MTTVSTPGLTELPTPDHITLLLKNHKQTVLLSALPSTSILDIKVQLLSALKSLNITSIDSVPVPHLDDHDEVELGVLKNHKDPSQGWISLEAKDQELADKAGKKKATLGKKGGSSEGLSGLGLGDGSMVAFRFIAASESKVQDDDDDDDDAPEEQGWNVVLPSYDDEPE